MPGAAELLASVRSFLSEPRCAVLSCLGLDGGPHQAVVHYMPADDHLLVNGRNDRLWVVNLRRDTRVSLIVHDVDESLHWVGLKGEAELAGDGEGAIADAMALARRYGEDPEPYRSQHRVSFRVVPRHVFEYR